MCTGHNISRHGEGLFTRARDVVETQGQNYDGGASIMHFVCMYVCMHVCTCACMNKYLPLSLVSERHCSQYSHICLYFVYVCVFMCVFACMCVYVYVCLCVCVCVWCMSISAPVVCCSSVLCVAVRCSVLQCVISVFGVNLSEYTCLNGTVLNLKNNTSTRCNTLQHAATHCNILRHNKTHWKH